MVVKMIKLRGNLTSFRLYSSLSVGFNRYELQERIKNSGIQLHFPQDEAQVKTRSLALALLVGWAESRQKALSKFAAIYTKQGIPCLSMACPITTMWFTSVGNKLTNSLLTSLDLATPPDDHPINLAMHIFSGGGTAVFPRLLEELAKPHGLLASKIRPKCVIFDSGPTEFSYKNGTAAAKLVYKQGGFNFLTYSASMLVGTALSLLIGSRKHSELVTALDSPLLNVPQLYLYSTADSVCSSERVERVMEEQREKGRSVESYSWRDSEHVRHMVEHPEQYEEILVQFLKKQFL
jgi:hypothetical protein